MQHRVSAIRGNFEHRAAAGTSESGCGAIEISGPVDEEISLRVAAVAAGARITRPLQDTPYGSREFAVKDPEGHSWSAGTYDPWAAQA